MIFLQQKHYFKEHFMKKTILLSLSLASSLLNAEDNGFFVSAGYQIGEAVQMVKNTGELKNLNEKYEQLNQYLNQVASLKQSIQNANNIELVNSSLNYLKSFTNNNYNSTTQSPIFNAVQAVITSVLGFWSLYAGNYFTFFVGNKDSRQPANVQGNPPFSTIAKQLLRTWKLRYGTNHLRQDEESCWKPPSSPTKRYH